jgi:hypothetical protein
VAEHVGDPEVRVRPHKERAWGATAVVETSAGVRRWFKAVGEGRPFEAALTVDIADVLPPERQVDELVSLLPAYAALQQAMGTPAEVERWIAVGLPDRRPARLPDLLDACLGHEAVDEPLARRCRTALPAFREVCAQLDGASLDHADLHGANVLYDGTGSRIVDWGDACATHPFATLFVTFELLLAPLPPPARQSAAERLRDTYLDAWTANGDRGTDGFRRTFDLAMRVAPIVRVLSLAEEADGGPELVDLLTAWSAAS